MTEMQVKERTERLLEKSGRITPRQVLEAYEKTGLEPATGLFLNGEKACAFGVLMIRDGVNPHASGIGAWIRARKAGRYSTGFYEGFDGAPLMRGLRSDAAARQGHRDGQRARRFVFGEVR